VHFASCQEGAISCLSIKKEEYKRANGYKFGSFEVSKN
jgi:hypothetical protein